MATCSITGIGQNAWNNGIQGAKQIPTIAPERTCCHSSDDCSQAKLARGSSLTDFATDHATSCVAVVSELTAAYVARNRVPASELLMLIASLGTTVDRILRERSDGRVTLPQQSTEPEGSPTSNEIRQSITFEALISFLDGKPYKVLKRHLSAHGLDPASYRERFGLPSSYPMVAPIYSERRGALARSSGLGTHRRKLRKITD